MAKTDLYYQFSAEALRTQKPWTDAGRDSIDDATRRFFYQTAANYGRSLAQGYVEKREIEPAELLFEMIDNHRVKLSDADIERLSEPGSAGDAMTLLGLTCTASKLDWTLAGTAKQLLSHMRDAQTQLDSGAPLARVRLDLVSDVPERLGWPEFRTYCAVVAATGAATFRKLSYSLIASLAAGYKSPEAVEQAKTPSSHLPTTNQLRTLTQRLKGRGLIRYLTPDGRNRFYSHRLNQGELEMQIALKFSAAEVRRQEQEERSRTLAMKADFVERMRAILATGVSASDAETLLREQLGLSVKKR